LKTDFTNTAQEILQYDAAGGPSSNPVIKTEYYSDTQSTWVEFEDVESRSLELSLENKRYLSYSFMPPAKSINIGLNNFGQVYSTGSGDAKASILKKNLLVRAWSGYELTISESQSSQSDDFLTNTKFVHTQTIGSEVFLDETSYSGTVALEASIGAVYGTTTYDATTYAYPGYYQKKFTLSDSEKQFKQVSITTTSNKFNTKYRVSPFSDFSGAVWSDYEALSTGSNTVDFVADQSDQYLQLILRWSSDVWSTADSISGISVLSEDNVFLLKQGTFVLDEPRFSNTKVTCRGRDYLKKALETEINLPDITSPVNIATAVSYVLDRCKIPYDRALWNVTSTTTSLSASLAEDLGNISGWKALDYMMDSINAGDDDWQLKTEADGKVSLKRVPTDIEADWSIHYFFNIESISKNFDSDKQLQRVTLLNKDIIVDSEVKIKNLSGTAGASLHATLGDDYLYVRYTDTADVISSETNRSNTAVDFGMNSGSGYSINLYGCTPKNAITNEIWSERGNSDNSKNNNGATYKRINPFMSQDMADDFTDYMIDLNGDPKKKVTVKLNPNPFIELNDNLLIFDLYTYTDDIYNVQSIKESWRDPELKHTLTLKDRGFNLGAFKWDRNGFNSGINDLNYDKGFVWDQDLGPNATGDSQDYSYLKSIG